MQLCRMSRFIKVLTDLENGGRSVFSIDMQDLKDLKRHHCKKHARCAGDNLANRVNLVNPTSDH